MASFLFKAIHIKVIRHKSWSYFLLISHQNNLYNATFNKRAIYEQSSLPTASVNLKVMHNWKHLNANIYNLIKNKVFLAISEKLRVNMPLKFHLSLYHYQGTMIFLPMDLFVNSIRKFFCSTKPNSLTYHKTIYFI